jgi:hypothetical protein
METIASLKTLSAKAAHPVELKSPRRAVFFAPPRWVPRAFLHPAGA